jgi:hypothetical protein
VPRTRRLCGSRGQDPLRFPVDPSLGEQSPYDPSVLVGQCDRDYLVGLAGDQSDEPLWQGDPALRLFDNRRGADDQQSSELAIALLGDRPELFFSAAGQEAWRETELGGEISSGFEALDVVDGCADGCGDQRPDAGNAGQAACGLIGVDAGLDFLTQALDAI